MLNKKIVLWVSGIISIILLLINFIGTYKTCNLDINCAQLLADTLRILFIIIPTFILSLITYKMRDAVYQAWLKFAYVWVPLTIILTLIAPEYNPSLFPITKGVVSFYMSVLFVIISTGIIIIKFRTSKHISNSRE